MKQNNDYQNEYRSIMELSQKVFGELNSNRRKSLIFRLLNYLRVGNYKLVNYEILRLLNVIEVNESDKNKFIEKWSKFCYGMNDKLYENAAYSLILGLLKINN